MTAAVVGYTYYGKPYVIGEAPGPRGGVPLEGARRRIGGLIGVTAEEMAELFEWQNLLADWPGYGPNGGSVFPMEAARQKADLIWYFRGGELILLGKRVAEAFRVRGEWFQWHRNAQGERTVVVVPHPSGLSRWWNDPDNVELARSWWKSQVRQAREQLSLAVGERSDG